LHCGRIRQAHQEQEQQGQPGDDHVVLDIIWKQIQELKKWQECGINCISANNTERDKQSGLSQSM